MLCRVAALFVGQFTIVGVGGAWTGAGQALWRTQTWVRASPLAAASDGAVWAWPRSVSPVSGAICLSKDSPHLFRMLMPGWHSFMYVLFA